MEQRNVVAIVEKYHPSLYLVWDVDAIEHLRNEHRRIGCFMNMRISKTRNSLPLQITAEELIYLRNQTCCTVHVVDKSLLSNVAFEAEIDKIDIANFQIDRSGISRCQNQLIHDYNNLVKKITVGDIGQQSQSMKLMPVEKSTLVPGDVLSALKEQFYTTGGLKFGCHLLLYPGNPLCYHASHMFYYFRPDDRVMVKNLLTRCRLGTHVNKAVVLATKKPNGTQIYITFNHVKIGKSGKSNFFFKKN
ncbi:tRNA-splicing endonuclease subunit Sen34 [Trichinella britovi]|uniref:tRNA-intron lyase n=1 Tax=Trichinella britovi TaxID=45882 RepID=A0A0V1CM68_TRIBR|nr:tRNA-splicing endonuclease subunit Sen34 [Trichinella britovi]